MNKYNLICVKIKKSISNYVYSLKYSLNFYIHIKHLYGRFENIFLWIPLLWKDYWFDSVYLYKIILHKLKLMEKSFREKGMCGDSKQIAEEISQVIADLEYLLSDSILSEELSKVDMRSKDSYLKCHEATQKREEELRHKIFLTLANKSFSWWD